MDDDAHAKAATKRHPQTFVRLFSTISLDSASRLLAAVEDILETVQIQRLEPVS